MRHIGGWACLACAVALFACRSASSPVARAPAAAAAAPSAAPPGLAAADVDRMLATEWRKRNIVPSSAVDDERFLRRVSLDIIGRIPTLEEMDRFESDRSEWRRRKVVATLLASPGYAEHWTNYWEDVLLLDKTKAKFVDRAEFRKFLHGEFERNAPWNDVVQELLSARGANRASAANGTEDSSRVNGAVNWLLQYRDNPQDLAGKTASTFLGVKIQCAQCHDHKTEKWKQTDFQRFAACFANMKAVQTDVDMKSSPVTLIEVGRPALPRKKNPELAPIAAAPPTALDGTDFSSEDDRRGALAAWTTSPRNPWFAKAFVNRMWGYFMGRGFVEPVDDFRASNPAELSELLEALANDFSSHGFDVKRLVQLITATTAYQLSAAPSAGGATSEPPALFSRYPLKPLGPDELLDSIAIATDLDEVLSKQRGDDIEKAKEQLRKQFNFLFDIDEESHGTSYEGTIPQALMLMNGRSVNQTMRVARQGALLKIVALPDDDAHRVEALFRRTLSRHPTPDERRAALALIPERGADRQRAFEDVFWALLNSSEFVFNH
jgi:hypothetical protein